MLIMVPKTSKKDGSVVFVENTAKRLVSTGLNAKRTSKSRSCEYLRMSMSL